jgi:RNA polymerase sigma-70 factor, ECF subfamily
MPMADLDEETMERCRRRDRAALTKFIERYQRPLFAYLSRLLGRGPHVEDIAQNAFLRAIEDFPAYDARLRPFSWLLTLARARYLQHDRLRRDRFVVLGLSAHDEDPDASSSGHGGGPVHHTGPWLHADADPERNASRAELGRAIERVVMSLGADQREAFLLSDYHEMAASDIAAITGCNENTVKSRIRLARARLRERLQIHWSDEREPSGEQQEHSHG